MRFSEVKEENIFDNRIEKFNHYQAFLSNDLKILAKIMQSNFVREEGFFFNEKIVLTSTPAMQLWLQKELGKPILFNTQLFSFSKGMMEIFSRVSMHDKRVPNRLETLILIEENLKNLENILPQSQDPVSIIYTFAQLFEKYGLYEERIADFLQEDNIQAKLYRKLYEIDPFISLTQSLKQKIKKTNCEIHLFAIPFFPPAFFEFLIKIGEEIPLFFYHLNVCKEYWTDLLSQQELFYIEQNCQKKGISEAQIQSLYDFSKAPFALANYGRLMREGLLDLEDNFFNLNEIYFLRKERDQLSMYQNSLLNFEEVDKREKDTSLQFHEVPSLIREIEVAKSLLYQLIFNEKIPANEIKILTTQFSEYSSLLKSELAEFPLVILYEQNMVPNSALEGLLLLLKLEENRFTKEAIIELFSFPSFAKKQGLHREDIEQIKSWIEYLNIRWGFNQEQKNRILKTVEHPQVDENNTFEQGLFRLIRSIAQEELVTLANIDLAAKFYELVNSIYAHILPFFDSQNRTIAQLIEQTKKILESFFAVEEGIIFEELVHSLLPSFLEKKMSFPLFLRYLEERIRKRAFFENQKGLDHIFCSSLQLGSQIPCRAAIVLGMHLDAFPKKEITASFDLLQKQKAYYPSNLDFEKNSFLELLNSCSGKLLFTYVKTPSLLLQELQDDLGEITTYHHPAFCTDPSYFGSTDPYYFSMLEKKESIIECVEKEVIEKKQEVLIEDLIRFVKAPLFPFFRERGLFFREKNEEDEEFSLSPLSKAKIVRKREEVASLIDELKKKGAFPNHGFGEITEQILLNDRKALEEILAFHQIKASEISSLYLSDYRLGEYNYKPIVLKEKMIKGQLTGITHKGLFLFEKSNFEGIIRALPSLAVVQITNVAEPTLLFGKEPHQKKILFSDPIKFLENLVLLYEEAHANLLFIYPEFILPLLEKDLKKLKSKIDDLSWKEYDPYFSFVINSQQLPTAEILIETLHDKVKECFEEIKDGNF